MTPMSFLLIVKMTKIIKKEYNKFKYEIKF